MTFRASNFIPEQGYRDAKAAAVQIKSYSAAAVQRLQASVNADVVLMIFHDIRRFGEQLDQIKIIPGLADYAKAQETDPTYDVVAEFTALVASMDAVKANILGTFPTDGSGYLLEKKFNAQGTYDYRQFTAAQTATLRGLLDTVANGIS